METAIAANARPGRLARYSGYALIALIVLGIVYAGQIVIKTNRYHAEAAAYVRDAVTSMAISWNSGELIRRASPEWLSPADYAGVERLFADLALLGRLKSLDEPSGRIGNGPYPGTRINGAWAEYAVRGEFDLGPCEFRMILQRLDQGWQLAGLRLESEALNEARKKKQ
jgi:hypothetical protein